jgi:hypothetical protein
VGSTGAPLARRLQFAVCDAPAPSHDIDRRTDPRPSRLAIVEGWR